MNLEINLTDAATKDLVERVVAQMIASGVVVAPPERIRPYSVTEAAAELGMSETVIRRDVEAGRLERIPNTGRILIPVHSIKQRAHHETTND